MFEIRKATNNDLSRIAEIFIFNNRINYYPIFNDQEYSFKKLTVTNVINTIVDKNILNNIYVYDDGIVKGFVEIKGKEINKLYVDSFFQNNGIGDKLIKFSIEKFDSSYLWALEKNTKAIKFYSRYGFYETEEKKYEEGTTEYIIKLIRK